MRQEWDNAITRLGGQARETDLERRYAESHRAYHTRTHIDAVLRDASALSDVDDPALVLAVCAHDVVYDAKPGADERASASWARARLVAAEVGEDHVARVEAMILATITHTSDDPATQVLLDADLAILASPAYDQYVTEVRHEYAAHSDDVWRAGRANVLESLLAKENLYQTVKARTLWEVRARDNIRRELRSL
jgi:predicted metal-dependent HD superfamily phosphohydrolase